MKTLSFLVKPVSAGCQLNCTYCFYKDIAENRSCANYGRMRNEVAVALLEKVFQAADADADITFAFQGGEPLLAGLPFYEQFADAVKQLRQPKQNVRYAIQTNGCLLNAAWCSFFHKHNVLVGVSLDGWRKQHDLYRKRKNAGTYADVMRAIQLLRRHHVDFNILSVLSRQLAREPKKLFAFYKEHGFSHVQLIPCLAPLQEKQSAYSLTPELFYQFYRSYFDLWIQDVENKQYQSVALFDNLLLLLQGKTPGTCGMLGECQFQYVVESDGSLYPCDFYVLDEYHCGNVLDTDLLSARDCSRAKAFAYREEPQLCAACPFQPMCHGNCKRLRSVFMNETQCGYQRFLLYAYPKLKEVVEIGAGRKKRREVTG